MKTNHTLPLEISKVFRPTSFFPNLFQPELSFHITPARVGGDLILAEENQQLGVGLSFPR